MRDPGLLQSIRSAVDIVQIIGEVLKLEKRGHNYFGCCPFHQEKTPSFSVSPDKQLFHCFGCKVGGDVFKFVQLYYRWEFPLAVEELARRAGIPYEKSKSSSTQQWNESLKILEAACSFFEESLYSEAGKRAQEYLQSRNIPKSLWKTFRIGFHPGGYRSLVDFLESKSLSGDIASRLGLIGKGRHSEWQDRFRERLIFPIADERGKIRGFGARSLGGEQPKYINSPNSMLFDKSKLLYGMHLATDSIRRKDYIVIVEGYLDVLALHEYGVRNVVCPMGTALTREQVRQLKRWSQRIVCLFDADSAGIQATERNLENFLAEGLQAKVAFMPEAKDPDAFLHSSKLSEAQKRDELARIFKKAKLALDYLIEKKILSLQDPIQRAKQLRLLVELLDRVPDLLERSLLKKEIAKRFDLPMSLFEETQSPQVQAFQAPKPRKEKPEPSNPWEREVLKFLVLWGKSRDFGLTDVVPYLSFPSKWSKLLNELIQLGMNSEEIARLEWLDNVDQSTQAEIREWVLKEEMVDTSKLQDIWNDLLKRLRTNYFKQQSLRLQSEIVEAESEGDVNKVKRLLSEKQDLAKMMMSFEV